MNALSERPPAPRPNAGGANANALSATAAAMPAAAPFPMGAPGAAQQPPQQQAPAPNHAQTVGTLLHLHAFAEMYRSLLAAPQLGRASLKSQVIDGVSKLVSQRYINTGQAVSLLSGFPDDPQDQRKWVQQHLARDRQAELMLLAHHAAGSTEGVGYDQTPPANRADDHLDMMSGMHAMYGGR